MAATGVNALVDAISRGDSAEIRRLIEADPDLLDTEIEAARLRGAPAAPGMRPIHAAVAYDQPAIVELLLDSGADIDARNGEGRTALHDSIEDGRTAITEILLERGAEVDICAAAIMGRADRVRELLNQRPALANDMTTGLEPLGWASYGNQPEIVRILVDHGAELAPGPLHNAASCGHTEVSRTLLELGADPNGRVDGRTPLHVAAYMPFSIDTTAVAALLLDAGADVNARNPAGKTPLAIALAGPQRERHNHPSAAPQEKKRFEKLAALLRQRGGEPSD